MKTLKACGEKTELSLIERNFCRIQVGGEIDFPAVWWIVRRILFIETLQQKGFFKSEKRDYHFPGAEGFS